MNNLTDGIRHGLRQLRHHPGHGAVVIVTLGLALGLATVIFSFVNFFLFRPLPIQDESTMVLVRSQHPERNSPAQRLSYADFADFRAQTTTIEELVALSTKTGVLTESGDAKRVTVAAASRGLFRVWNLQAVAGRRLEDVDSSAASAPAVVLSSGFWQRELGADPQVVGRTLVLDGRVVTVAGVLTPAIEVGGFSGIDLWTALAESEMSDDRLRRDMLVTGRLRPGATIEAVNAEFSAIAARLEQAHPSSNQGWTTHVIPLREGLYGQGTKVILGLLVVGVCLVFAVACANVAGIVMARATTRERELALRLTLGAEPRHIARQLLMEGVALSLFGAMLGMGLAQLALLLMRAVAFEQFFSLVAIDFRVVAFSAALALVAPLLFSLAPALHLRGRQLSGILRDSAGSVGASGRVGRGRRGLVVTQIGLATALLIVAGLSVRTALSLQDLDLGFDKVDLLSVRIDLAEARYPTPDSVREALARLLNQLGGLAGPSGAAVGSERPVFDPAPSMAFSEEGALAEDARITAATVAGPGYFKVLGLPIRRGRDIQASDRPEAPPVVIINEALAARDFSGRDPLGARVRVGGVGTPSLEVVGVVANIANATPGREPVPQAYLPFAQRPERSVVLFVRTRAQASALARLRDAMRAIDPQQPLYDAKTLEQVGWEQLASTRIITGLFMALGSVALALASAGLYGLTAFVVAQRSREIGVRMALGASVRDIHVMVAAEGLKLTGPGLAAGVALGLALGRAMSSVLVGVKPWDPLTLGMAVSTLAVFAIMAHWTPAQRAVRVNPIDALRHDAGC